MWQSAGLLSCVRVVAKIYVKWLPHLLICYLTYLPDWQPFYYPYNRYHLKKKQIHLSIQQYNNSYLRLNSNNILFHSHYLHNNNYLPKSVPPTLLVV